MSPATATAQPSTGSQAVLGVLVLAGAAAFLYGIMNQPTQTWGIYLVNVLFWSSLGITGPALAGMIQITEGRWSPSIKRIALTTAGFLPASFVLFVILFAGRTALYPWVTNPVPVKATWLNVPFMSLRIGLGVLALYGVALTFAKAVIAEDQPGGASPQAVARRNRLATLMLILYVVVLSLWSFDLVMTIDPTWYSGLFGGYYVVTSLYTGFGLVTFLTIRSNSKGITSVPASAIQDVTKLTFAMCVMWMYFFFSQYLVIWYGNVPVETKFFLRRFFVDPWRTLAFVIFIFGALIPFCYLLKRLTGRPPTRHKVLVVILFFGLTCIFLERIMLVFPALSKDNAFPLGVIQVLITAGFFGLFALSRGWFLNTFRPALNQPR